MVEKTDDNVQAPLKFPVMSPYRLRLNLQTPRPLYLVNSHIHCWNSRRGTGLRQKASDRRGSGLQTHGGVRTCKSAFGNRITVLENYEEPF